MSGEHQTLRDRLDIAEKSERALLAEIARLRAQLDLAAEHPPADLPVATGDAATEGCIMHGERETFTAPFVGYVKEPGCTCTALPTTSAAGSSPEDAARRACLAAWPEAEAGAHNPACCRFPKSCSIPEDAGERVGLLREIEVILRAYAEPVTSTGKDSLHDAARALSDLVAGRLAAVEQERDVETFKFENAHKGANIYRERAEAAEREAAALREQVAAVAALGEELAAAKDLLGPTFDTAIAHEHAARIRGVLADPASVLAQRDAEVVNEFVHWVAVARAHNGSEHQHGQSLYNECINAALPEWAREWQEARDDDDA